MQPRQRDFALRRRRKKEEEERGKFDSFRKKKRRKKKRRRKRKRRREGREIFRIRFGSIRKVIFIGSAIPLELPSVPLKDRESSEKGEYSPIDVFP